MSNTNQGIKLSRAQTEQIVALVENGHSFRETARILGISDATVRKYVAGSDLDLDVKADQDTLLRLGRQTSRLSQANKGLQTQIRKIQERGFGYDDFIDAMRKLIEAEKKNPFQYYPSKFAAVKSQNLQPPVDPDHTEIASLALSDWHLAEKVDLLGANGINVYNTLIGANRLWHIVQRFKQVFAIHRHAFKITKIWLPVLGDMVSGSIHPEFIVTNDMSDHAATLLGYRMLRMVIEELKQLGVPIELDCVVGNHPRTTFKVPTKDIAHSNWDWLMYEMTNMHFEKDKQVKVNVHTSQLGIVEQFGHRYVVEHGIEWKNNREEDFESAIRDILDDSIYRDATGLKGSSFDGIVIGNLHKPAFMERTVKNGSLIGQNELGQQWRLKPIKAQQLAWGISRSHVRTWQYQLDATKIKSMKAENPFSEFALNFLKDHGRYQLLS
jgi:DNA-binding CsgD family transcriptional regulator